MGSILSSPELNTVLISSLIGIIIASGGAIVAWLQAQTKKFNRMAEETKNLAVVNNELLEKNTKIALQIEKQTDGLNKKMAAIAAAAAFTKGRVQGRAEGESGDEYDELDKLEDLYSTIIHDGYPKPKQ